MCPISNRTRPDGYGETSGEATNTATSFTGKDYYQELINRANTIPLSKVFRQYNIRLDAHNKKVTCPFKSHKGGRESTPSFYFYPDTNSFYCFGCKGGTRACDFVATMDNCTKVQAAHKLLEMFESDVDEDNIYDKVSFSERLEIMMDFSTVVREFHQTFPSDRARLYVEAACKKYDVLNLKKKLSNEALRSVVDQIKEYIKLYKP